jgi:putative transposase
VDDLRIHLVERLCRIDASHLPAIEQFIDAVSAKAAPQTCAISAYANTEKPWPHAPVHRLDADGAYLVTGSTVDKAHFFQSPERLTILEDRLLSLAKHFEIDLEAWAVFSNHYHFIAKVKGSAEALGLMVARLHSESATAINRLDECPGRQVWFNFWDTHLTFENSYLCRLNYVHQNAVKHGLVKVAHQYPWCSAAWFERVASRAQVNAIYSFKIDRVKVDDDYEPV